MSLRTPLLAGLAALCLSTTAAAQEEPPPWAAPAQPQPAPQVQPQPNDPSTWPAVIPVKEAGNMDLSKYGYQRTRKANIPLLVTGVSLFAPVYGASTLVGATAMDIEGDGWAAGMFVPVVGPIIWAASEGGTSFTTYLLVIDALAQGTGVALMALGARGKEVWKKDTVPSFMVAPAVSYDQIGFTASGTF